jgi:hypothetical protein
MSHSHASALLALALVFSAQDAAPVQAPAQSLIARFHAKTARAPTSYRARRVYLLE